MALISFEHHSYLVVGPAALALLFVREALEKKIGRPLANYPDLFFSEHALFGVAESRLLKAQAAGKPLADEKFIIVQIGTTTGEAQNALLKVLEEPALGTRIFIIARSARIFLPTVLSRLEVVILPGNKGGATEENEPARAARAFLTAVPSRRLALVATWQKENKLTKDFLADLLDRAEESLAVAKERRRFLWPLMSVRRYLYDKALLPKMLLEYLAVALPVAEEKH